MPEKTEIVFITCERWHCIDMLIDNIRQASKPRNYQVLAVVQGSRQYMKYVRDKFEEFAPSVRAIKIPGKPVDHSILKDKMKKVRTWKVPEQDQKKQNVETAFRMAVENSDDGMDLYWIIEDDTLFPLDTFKRYRKIMEAMKGDAVSGVSYSWHNERPEVRNFWEFVPVLDKKSDENVSIPVFTLKSMPYQESGVSRLGSTGTGNVLAKNKPWTTWEPKWMRSISSGADISFWLNSYLRGYPAYGIWDVRLPHITTYPDGDIAIIGRLDKSLHHLVGLNGNGHSASMQEDNEKFGEFLVKNVKVVRANPGTQGAYGIKSWWW